MMSGLAKREVRNLQSGALHPVPTFGRREALRLGGQATVALWSTLSGVRVGAQALQPIPSWKTELRQLLPHVFAYTQASGPGVNNASLSNAGVIVGSDGLLAIDTLGPPVHTKAFRRAAMEATRKTFTRVVNTHHHRDHTNGNCFFAPAEIVAHEYCREATIQGAIPAKPYAERPEWQEGMSELKLAPATTTLTAKTTYRYGDLVVELIPNTPAHTWGDVMVYLPQHRILFAGDIVFHYVTPAAHNGHISKWIDALDVVNRMDVDVIVPGHGPIGTKKELAETRAYLELVANELRKRFAMGMTPGRAAADINVGRFEQWTNPERNAWNAVRVYAELDGTITPENDAVAQANAVAEYAALRAKTGR
jgi:cyclase